MKKDRPNTHLENADRRNFIKNATSALVGAGAAGLLPGATQTVANAASGQTEPKWDREADVVVVGYGGAGAVAAIAAHDAGAKVLIVESTAQGGGNTAVSAGGFVVPKDADKAIAYITSLFDASFSEKDEEMIKAFALETMQNIEWLQGLKAGVKVMKYGGAGYRQAPGADAIEKYMVLGEAKGMAGGAKNLFGLLRYAVEEKRRIPVMVKSPARELVTDCSGKVLGLIVDTGGKTMAIRSRKGVILATGGYEAAPRMLQNFVKGHPIHFIGHPGNRGDGIRMAQKVGAGLWHMNSVSCALGLKVPEYASAFFMLIMNSAHILVDRHGHRFANEKHIEAHASLLAVDYYDTHALEYPRIPCYAIFDETVRQKGPISLGTIWGAASRQYKWSKDNQAEIDKGWIAKGETLAQLAGKIHLDPAALENTVSKWNQDVAGGQDTRFGRKVTGGKTPISIDSAPFYAVELHPALLNTQGGPRRNARAQVLDANGEPIPGLYSAGELGSLWGMIYQGAGNIAECMAFGRIAGRNAAAAG